MNLQLSDRDFLMLAPAGHYLALRVGFAFPLEEINALPAAWVEYYTAKRFMMADPVIRWSYNNTGATRWSEISLDDPRGVFDEARRFGLNFGAAISYYDDNAQGQRSFGSFARSDREYTRAEIDELYLELKRLHEFKAPPQNLTLAEKEALSMVRDGLRLKQIAYELGVSEGAVKQRLRNAKTKLNAQTGAQAAAMASSLGLI